MRNLIPLNSSCFLFLSHLNQASHQDVTSLTLMNMKNHSNNDFPTVQEEEKKNTRNVSKIVI